ncbi:MAG: hypothetical protein AAFQ82_25750, partial [Myxococcota bacterium]
MFQRIVFDLEGFGLELQLRKSDRGFVLTLLGFEFESLLRTRKRRVCEVRFELRDLPLKLQSLFLRLQLLKQSFSNTNESSSL